QCLNILLARVMRAKLRAVVRIEPALEKISHDAGLDELPICFACDGEFANLLFSQLKYGRLFKEMAVEMANLVRSEGAALRHFSKQIFEHLGEMCRVIDTRLEDVGDDVLRQQSRVFGKKAEDDSIEETSDAQILALSDG